VSYLVAIEGADGAGKATASENVRRALLNRGIKATVISFPRYRETVGGFALGEFLSGRMPVPVTAQTAAVLYALDRLESRPVIGDAQATNDVVIFDRYIASNVAYQAAKIHSEEVAPMIKWIIGLETNTFGIYRPDLNVYLDTPLEISTALVAKKHQRSYTGLIFDKHESDHGLQRRVREIYMDLAETDLLGPWVVIPTARNSELREPLKIADEIVAHIVRALN
jgi:dTMP kinase